jgi:hypothetical protein
MINKCSSVDKYIVIRLTEDMLMHEFALINREFYSSNLRNFEVYIFYFFAKNSKFKNCLIISLFFEKKRCLEVSLLQRSNGNLWGISLP